MKKLTYMGVAAVIGVLLGIAFLWAASEMKERKNPLNKFDAFVYSDKGTLNWFELTSRNGKVEGKFYRQKIMEVRGEIPFIEEKTYYLTGKSTEKGYEFKVNKGSDIILLDAWISGEDLFIQKQGEEGNKVFKAVNEEELNKNEKTMQQELQIAIDQMEEKEKNRLKKLFSDLNSIYGFLYSRANDSYQLLLTINEATLEGEVAGTLLMMTNKGRGNNSYEETSYDLNGITDGLMVELFTTVDGKKTKLEGNFHEGASGFDLSFWTTNEKLPFYAVTEEEFNNIYEKFKEK
ncbi:hypothetical protein [Cytobacillus horneckiae]|uniref:hypothetical protein n=1 Tax=Cytobacillus horneckiae TaxID=549687 RepID=UPI00203A3945|nr:hypothetical protein [Cytobacillus horneckiae]MCM3176671.1 hypothetical protein [Cytobacillus horneckiae]